MLVDSSRFFTASLRSSPQGGAITRILAAAIEAVEPGKAVQKYMLREPLPGRGSSKDLLSIGPARYDLTEIERIFIVGAGKGGAPMAEAAAQILADRQPDGVVIVKEGYAGERKEDLPVSIVEAGHPLPDQRGIQGTAQIIHLVQEARARDLVICLISGGGSALLVSPVEGLTLADLQAMTSTLLASGASIQEINTLRKHLDRVKGGKLARLAAPAQLAALILSDVVGDPLEVIASGPTVPDPTTFADALEVLERYQIVKAVPNGIVVHLRRGQRGDFPENPKPGDSVFEKVNNTLIGSNQQAANAAIRQAEAEGFHALLLTTYLQGEARQAGRLLASIARQIEATGKPTPRPACVVLGGETTVTLQGTGKGGRNQELALSAVEEIAGLHGITLVAMATDGGDGPTDAGGAVVTGETLECARQAGLDPADFLARNDAYHFFEPLGDLLMPGPTQTNVNDLTFLFAL